LPGEPLFYIKKVSEKIQTEFVSKEEKPKVDLELTNKRLEELKEIAEKNDTKKLASAIKEIKEVSGQASKSLKEIKNPKEIVETTKKIVQSKTYAQKFGVEIPLEDLSTAYKDLAESQIKDLENRSLTETQQEILKEAKEFFEKGDYPSAFLKAIEASQIR
jgi:predicted S18 family serine protease